jgi:hypothetical protein
LATKADDIEIYTAAPSDPQEQKDISDFVFDSESLIDVDALEAFVL